MNSMRLSPVLRLLVFGAIGACAGFIILSVPATHARTPRGVSGRDFAALVECVEENDITIADLCARVSELKDLCEEEPGPECDFDDL